VLAHWLTITSAGIVLSFIISFFVIKSERNKMKTHRKK
jgi:hypothetical protein